MDQISLFWPVLVQHTRLALLLASVALSLAIYAARRRVQRLKVLAVAVPLTKTLRS